MKILRESKIEILQFGSVIGTEGDIKNWAEGTSLPGIFYHYSPNRDVIMKSGFKMNSDGIYFALDDKFSKTFGDGKPPIKVMIQVSRDKLLSGPLTNNQKKIVQEWEEEEPELARRLDSGEDIDILGRFMSDCGFLVMNDGTQLIVQSTKCIGIIQD